ncbi:DUF4124 domain-containing protein [Seongchinamella unica]|uniref:DUF4124 domain-containing protein n=1 Tax=Seongchinamella unica TaxID=2547392 RepID=A0A4R5LP98_9GAMM|nr:DUF4124 domain-containing protein [Seongchinamella unica]TDG12362.1 DUF4124 domain-containing protein [Seongchinamella unica]
MTRSKRTFILATIFASTLVSSVAVCGTVHYRWIDDRGNPVHSDRPPPKGIDYEVITTGSGLKRVVSGDQGAVPPEVKPRVGNEFTQVDEEEARRSKKNPELCSRAKTNLEALTGNAKVRIRDDQGEERFLTEEEVIVEREKAKAQVSVYCP